MKGPERDGSRGGTDLSMDCVLPVESGATRDSGDVANMWWDKELSCVPVTGDGNSLLKTPVTGDGLVGPKR